MTKNCYTLIPVQVFPILILQICSEKDNTSKKLLVHLPSHQRPRRVKRPMYPKNLCTSALSPSDPEDFFSSTVPSKPVI